MHRMNRTRFHAATALFACLVCLPLIARAADQTAPDPALASKIDALLADPALKGGIQGVVIQSLADGRVWYEHNPELLFLPASNQKLLTSSAVLNALGPDWRYETVLLRGGPVDDSGTLHGNLYLKGSGDPLLAASDLDAMVEQVKGAGIKKVAGKVVGDDSRFDHQRYGTGWEWDDMPYYYSAQISGLNLDENVVRVTVDPGRAPGDPVRVTIKPTDRYTKLTVRARTTEKGGRSALRITRELGRNDIVVEGTLAVDAKPQDHRPEPITVDNPTRFAAFYLEEALERASVMVTGGIGDGETPTSGTTEVARHEGEPFSEVLKKLNKPSDNLVAECLLKTLGAAKGKAGSTAAGREVAEAWFKSIGFDMGGLDMTDGSGLSRENFVSPHNFAALLKTMASHPYGKVWMESLPIAGVDGTLRNRMKGTPAAGNCVAKSGYVSSVSSLSGYVTTKDDERLLFTILMNNHKARNAVATGIQDRIVELLASYARERAAKR